jgi:hypothetical protein
MARFIRTIPIDLLEQKTDRTCLPQMIPCMTDFRG